MEKESDTSATLKLRISIKSPTSTVAGVPPPTRDLNYMIALKATDSEGRELSAQKSLAGKRALWRMPDGFSRFGDRDSGGDDWAARGTYSWMDSNRTLLREINDISGEHGRNLQHETHAKGTDIDMYHFFRFPGGGSGTDNYNKLSSDVIAAFGTLAAMPTSASTAAFNRVQAWVSASRTGLSNLDANANVAQLFYCEGTALTGVAAGWCRQLLRQGTVDRTITVNGMPQMQTVTFGAWANIPVSLRHNNVHDNHIHVTLDPPGIGE